MVPETAAPGTAGVAVGAEDRGDMGLLKLCRYALT
jgi:hypothetical protein